MAACFLEPLSKFFPVFIEISILIYRWLVLYRLNNTALCQKKKCSIASLLCVNASSLYWVQQCSALPGVTVFNLSVNKISFNFTVARFFLLFSKVGTIYIRYLLLSFAYLKMFTMHS